MSAWELVFGAMADSIEAQLRKQGYKIVGPAHAQQLADAITLLAIHGILTDAEKQKARQRLMKRLKMRPLAERKP